MAERLIAMDVAIRPAKSFGDGPNSPPAPGRFFGYNRH
jgi:hypothetical protein